MSAARSSQDEKISDAHPNNAIDSLSSDGRRLQVSPSGADLEDDEVVVGWRTWLAIIAGATCPWVGYYVTIITAFWYTTPAAILGAGAAAVWLPNGFAIINAGIGPTVAHFAEIYGRKNVLLVGMTINIVGSIVVATAKDWRVVTLGGCIMTGCNSMQGVFFAIPSEILPRRMRAIGQAIFSFTGGLASTCTLLVSGALIQAYPVNGWRYGYAVQAGFGGVSVLMLATCYWPKKLVQPEGTTKFDRVIHEIDWVGAFLQSAFTTLFLVSLNWGSSAYPYSDPHFIAPFTISIVMLICLIVHQWRFQKRGVWDHELFVSRNFALGMVAIFIEGAVFLAFNVIYPLQLSTLFGVSPFMQAVRFMPLYLSFAIFAPLFGWISKKTLELNYGLIVGWLLILVAAAMLGTTKPDGLNVALGAVIIAGCGLSSLFALISTAVQLGVPTRLLGLASAQTASVRAVGIAIGTPIAVQIYAKQAAKDIPSYITSAVTNDGISAVNAQSVVAALTSTPADTSAALAVPGMTQSILADALNAQVQATSKALHAPWYWTIALCAVAAILSYFYDRDFVKRAMNWVVERPVEEVHHVHDANFRRHHDKEAKDKDDHGVTVSPVSH